MRKTGIFYFSSTGNSLYIARILQQELSGEVIYIPSYEGDGSEFEEIIIVTPIYSFGLPVPTLELLSRLKKGKEIIAVQNYGGMVGGADRLLFEYGEKAGLVVKSVYTLKMPENFTLVMSPPKFYTKSILKSASKRILKVASAIKSGKNRIPKKKHTYEKTYLKNKSNWHKIGERFSVNEKCVSCGKCAAICPVHNIEFKEGKPVFLDKCIACLGCFHRCPHHAIIYQGKDNKKRYINPLINEHDIGKNF